MTAGSNTSIISVPREKPELAQLVIPIHIEYGSYDSTAAGEEDAVYAGFGLEQTQRSARGVDLTMPLCHQIIPEPFCAFRLSPIFASKSPVNQLWC